MTPIVFTFKKQPEFVMDLSELTPDKLYGLNKAQIKNIEIQHGNDVVTVNEIFTVTGDDTENIHIHRSNAKVVRIGQGMTRGSIEVKGHAGDFTGQYMKGGHITVKGNSGSWTGCSMKNGTIEITGNVADFLGAGLPGDPFGMSDGLILVNGDAGDRAGDRMRRGCIIIKGKAGDYCGSRMAAGTIIVLDKAGKFSGFGMKRGTIILAKKPNHIAATFKSCGNLKMQFLRLLFKQLSEMGKQFTIFRKYGPEVHRFAGDLASNGKGEILILQTIKTGSHTR